MKAWKTLLKNVERTTEIFWQGRFGPAIGHPGFFKFWKNSRWMSLWPPCDSRICQNMFGFFIRIKHQVLEVLGFHFVSLWNGEEGCFHEPLFLSGTPYWWWLGCQPNHPPISGQTCKKHQKCHVDELYNPKTRYEHGPTLRNVNTWWHGFCLSLWTLLWHGLMNVSCCVMETLQFFRGIWDAKKREWARARLSRLLDPTWKNKRDSGEDGDGELVCHGESIDFMTVYWFFVMLGISWRIHLQVFYSKLYGKCVFVQPDVTKITVAPDVLLVWMWIQILTVMMYKVRKPGVKDRSGTRNIYRNYTPAAEPGSWKWIFGQIPFGEIISLSASMII